MTGDMNVERLFLNHSLLMYDHNPRVPLHEDGKIPPKVALNAVADMADLHELNV